jgi:hypothetical protein
VVVPDVLQWVGAVLVAVGVGLLVGSVLNAVAGVGCGLIVLGVGVVAFGVAKEREVVTDGPSTSVART